MNNKRREILRAAVGNLEKAAELVDRALQDESDSMDNLPENLWESDRYCKMESAVEALDEAADDICESIAHIQEAMA